MKSKFEAACRETDRVKEQWSKKIQQGHDKVAASEKTYNTLLDAHKILQLDNEVTLQELKDPKVAKENAVDNQECKTKVNQQKENKRLKLSMRSMRTNQKVENDKIKKAVREAVALKDAIMQRIQNDQKSDVANIREDLMVKEELNKDIKKEAEITSLEEHVAAVDEVHEALKKKLEDERANKGASKDAGLEKERAAERTETKRLREQLSIIMGIAAAATTKA